MKKILYISSVFCSTWSMAQTETKPEEVVAPKPAEAPVAPTSPQPEEDTIRFKVGKSRVIVITPVGEEAADLDIDSTDVIDTVDASPEEYRNSEAKWAGLDFGYNMNLNAWGEAKFDGHNYWQNDPAKSFHFRLNIFEKRFGIIKEYVGITTGLGFNFNSFGIKNNYDIVDSGKFVSANESGRVYSKNLLKVSYVEIPVLLQFNTNKDNDKGFYLTTGVIGGVRMGSKLKKEGKVNGEEFEEKSKGVYGLNPFKVDLTARAGYKNIGCFVNYSVLSLFEADKTVGVYPLSFGLSMGF